LAAESREDRGSPFWDRVEFALGVIALVILSRGFILFLVNRDVAVDGEASGSAIRFLLAGIYFVTALWFVRHPKAAAVAIRSAPAVWLLVALAIISVLWSFDPSQSLRRGVGLLFVTAFGAYLALRYSFLEQVRLLVVFALVSFFLNIAFIGLVPDFAIDVDPRGTGWRGIYSNKNALGLNVSLGLLIISVAATYAEGHRRKWFVGLALGVPLLIASRSLTSIVALLCTLIAAPIYRVLLDSPRKLAVALIPFAIVGLTVFAWIIVGHLEPITGLMGRDPTFTGRTEIWAAAWRAIEQRPILGYGYNAFRSAPVDPLSFLRVPWVWRPTHAHNGIINLWVDLGFVGVFTFVASYVGAYTAAYRLAAVGRGAWERVWPLIFVTFFLIYNIAEVSIIVVAATPCVVWVLYVATVVSLHASSRLQSDAPHRMACLGGSREST
jgi:O-antigen ligase